MEKAIQRLFERYQRLFQQALHDDVDMDDVTSSYATAFIAASPAGVGVGANDEKLKDAMRQGFEHYRRIGTKDMQLRQVNVMPIDDLHCLARDLRSRPRARRYHRFRRSLSNTAARRHAQDFWLDNGR